jgi:hypothetical protein
VYQDEEQQPNEPEFAAISAEKVARAIEEINEALKDKEVDPTVRQKLKMPRRSARDLRNDRRCLREGRPL